MCHDRSKKQTLRQEMISALEKGPMTVRDISQSVGLTEKDVYHHLAFIEKTLKHQNKKIHVQPYHCMDCGFQFKNRKTFKKPGRCPECRDGRIAPAVLQIVTK